MQHINHNRLQLEAEGLTYPPKPISGMKEYEDTYRRSMMEPDKFWTEQANQLIHWERPFETVLTGGFEQGDVRWFGGGKLNACVNCVDRHLPTKANQVAIIWEGDEPGTNRWITYQELHREVCQIANALKYQGVRKGDVVTVYMPMIPELAMTMLACARIGAIHNVVFAGFSAHALADRVTDAKSKWIVTANEGVRGGRTIPLKQIVDEAIDGHQLRVDNVFVFKRTDTEVRFHDRDIRMTDMIHRQRPFVAAEVMDSEDSLFVLYTSGSTGKPKGLVHTTAGYLTWVGMTTRETFDLREDDVMACVADVGWITGHSYVVYGPLINGSTTVMFESTPLYPDSGRYWSMVERHKITQFYTSPTAIRSLMKYGDDEVRRYDRSSLRVLGSVGEPINFDAWKWYHDVVGERHCSVVDTWWQTETGGQMITAIPGKTPTKPGSCSFPMYGVGLEILNVGGQALTATHADGLLTISRPWPGMARTIYNDHERYLSTYMRPFPGHYLTGDGCHRDEDGFYWITGRVDDVINSSGHRIGTSEIENALDHHDSVVESAVIGFPHDTKGEGIACFVVTTAHTDETQVEKLPALLIKEIRTAIGSFATPDFVIVVPMLPKTRSGKIMRRVLRKVFGGERDLDHLGDISTLSNPQSIEMLVERLDKRFQRS